MRWFLPKSHCREFQCKLNEKNSKNLGNQPMDVFSINKLIQDSDMTCVPKKYENLKTQFQIGNRRVDGPDAGNLIVTDCNRSHTAT